jgi:predicted AlkP superfamily pyrophosphatase or phosphodiesterase
MKKIYYLFAFFAVISAASVAQTKAKAVKANTSKITTYPTSVARPKLVVGMVIDQMRWDYLYRFYDRYTNGGFRRLINEGFSVENTFIPYTPTYTACGHTSIFTGSVPAINGIIGNSWYDAALKRTMYCAEDSSVTTIGSNTMNGRMSPKNMISNTITDELRLATNFRSKVIGIALKDRGSILPAGHSANAAYWYDGQTGDWISSSYYMKSLPAWVQDYNKIKLANKFYEKNWNTLYPIDTYVQSSKDANNWERKFKGEPTSAFPHALKLYIGKDYEMIKSTPYGNTMTLDIAKLAILSEDLGQDNITDFLTVSCSSTDVVGHQFGPNSVEAEDTFLRLDKDLEEFFNYLDNKVGKGNYLFFLTADHGAAHAPGFLNDHNLPGGNTKDKDIIKQLGTLLEEKFNVKKPIKTSTNNQIYLDHEILSKAKVDLDLLKSTAVEFLKKQPGFQNAVDLSKIGASSLPEKMKMAITNGYNPQRSGDLYYALEPNWFSGGGTGTTHGAWNPYDSHIPLVFMGWNVKAGKTNTEHHMTDIAATVAAMLRIQMPNGCIGKPITELTHQHLAIK